MQPVLSAVLSFQAAQTTTAQQPNPTIRLKNLLVSGGFTTFGSPPQSVPMDTTNDKITFTDLDDVNKYGNPMGFAITQFNKKLKEELNKLSAGSGIPPMELTGTDTPEMHEAIKNNKSKLPENIRQIYDLTYPNGSIEPKYKRAANYYEKFINQTLNFLGTLRTNITGVSDPQPYELDGIVEFSKNPQSLVRTITKNKSKAVKAVKDSGNSNLIESAETLNQLAPFWSHIAQEKHAQEIEIKREALINSVLDALNKTSPAPNIPSIANRLRAANASGAWTNKIQINEFEKRILPEQFEQLSNLYFSPDFVALGKRIDGLNQIINQTVKPKPPLEKLNLAEGTTIDLANQEKLIISIREHNKYISRDPKLGFENPQGVWTKNMFVALKEYVAEDKKKAKENNTSVDIQAQAALELYTALNERMPDINARILAHSIGGAEFNALIKTRKEAVAAYETLEIKKVINDASPRNFDFLKNTTPSIVTNDPVAEIGNNTKTQAQINQKALTAWLAADAKNPNGLQAQLSKIENPKAADAYLISRLLEEKALTESEAKALLTSPTEFKPNTRQQILKTIVEREINSKSPRYMAHLLDHATKIPDEKTKTILDKFPEQIRFIQAINRQNRATSQIPNFTVITPTATFNHASSSVTPTPPKPPKAPQTPLVPLTAIATLPAEIAERVTRYQTASGIPANGTLDVPTQQAILDQLNAKGITIASFKKPTPAEIAAIKALFEKEDDVIETFRNNNRTAYVNEQRIILQAQGHTSEKIDEILNSINYPNLRQDEAKAIYCKLTSTTSDDACEVFGKLWRTKTFAPKYNPDARAILQDPTNYKTLHQTGSILDIVTYLGTGVTNNTLSDKVQPVVPTEKQNQTGKFFDDQTYKIKPRAELALMARQELLNRAREHGVDQAEISTAIKTGKFHPHIGDLNLAYEAFGRPTPDEMRKDPYKTHLASLIANGMITAPGYDRDKLGYNHAEAMKHADNVSNEQINGLRDEFLSGPIYIHRNKKWEEMFGKLNVADPSGREIAVSEFLRRTKDYEILRAIYLENEEKKNASAAATLLATKPSSAVPTPTPAPAP